jgi:peptidoglycan/LPS O-acetylase OafA/YrhL
MIGRMGLVRLFLALVVAADHWRIVMLRPQSIELDDWYKLGFNAGYAVLFFYIVSGFLITYTLGRNYSRDLSGTLAFYRNRGIRIYSLYWPMVIVTFLALPVSWMHFMNANPWDQLTGIVLFGQDWRLAFASYPQTHPQATITGLQQAWTLGAELTFYVMAPFLMRSWKIAAALLAVSFGTRAAFVAMLGTAPNDVWLYHFIATTYGFFMLGHLVCLAGQRWKPLAQPALGWLLLACSAASMMYAGPNGPFDGLRLWGAALFFTLALPGLFESTRNIRWMNTIGDLSYPVYLVHLLLILLIGESLFRVTFPTEWLPLVPAAHVSIASFLAVSIVAAAAVHWFLEKPVAAALQYLSGGRPKLRPAQ